MKTLKKVLAIFAVIALVLSFAAVGASAAPVKGTITIKDSPTVSVSGKTFKAYKILDAKFADVNNPAKGIAYEVPAVLEDFFAKRYTLNKADKDFDQAVAEKIAAEPDLQAFAKDVLKEAKAKRIAPATATGGVGATEAKFTNLDLGYYVVEDMGAATPISALALDTTTPDAVITLKAEKPTVDKNIDGDTDTDPATNGKVPANSASIGDKVPFVVTSKVPDMTGYTKYFYVFNDTLSKGLKYNNDLVVKVNGEVLKVNTDYTVTVKNNPDGTTGIKVVFKDFYGKYNTMKDAPIELTYSATVDTDAVIGVEGNPNKVNLTYSNNPNIVPQGVDEPTPGEKDKVTGVTPDSVTKTFVTALEIHKVDADKNRLTGAEFQIEGERLNQVIVVEDVYTAHPSGKHWKLKDGSYTTTAPTGLTTDQYESTTQKYLLSQKSQTITTTEHVFAKGVVGADGTLRFEGLGAGEYIITEIKAPEGYNILKDPINVTITCGLPENGTDNCTWTTSENAVVEDGIVKIDIENKTGSELPSTGGMGTTILYIVGGILLVGAAVLLIVKKRMALAK